MAGEAQKRRRVKAVGRSTLARQAHFRTGAGAMGGSRRLRARRRRRSDRLEEREAQRPAREPEGEQDRSAGE
jgi:hypothetical protein